MGFIGDIFGLFGKLLKGIYTLISFILIKISNLVKFCGKYLRLAREEKAQTKKIKSFLKVDRSEEIL